MASEWRVTHLAFGAVLVGVTGFFVVTSLHDDFPLAAAGLCMFTWLIVPPAWAIVWAIRRSYHGPPGPSEIAEMMIRQSEAERQRPKQQNGNAHRGPHP